MLVAYRLAGLSALEGHYAGVSVSAQFGGALRLRGTSDDFRASLGSRAEDHYHPEFWGEVQPLRH